MNSGHAPRLQILAIDLPDQNELVSQALANLDQVELFTAHADTALKQLLTETFSLILIDVGRDDNSGYELAALIRQVRRTARIPILFINAPEWVERAVFRGHKASLVDYLSAPLDPRALRTKALSMARHGSHTQSKARAINEMECLVRDRSTQLIAANETLRQEVLRRKHAELGFEAATLEAQAAARAKSEFLANMSHEIRTPMNGIFGVLDLMHKTALTREQQEYLSMMKVSAGMLLSVINDILDFSRIESGSLQIESVPFSLRTCVSESLKTLSFEAHNKGLELVCDIDPPIPDALLGDALRLRQILTNLISNAIKFTVHGEVIVRFRLCETDGIPSLRCSVADSGIGIAPKTCNEIFSPFTQADSSTTRLYGGSGLGLSIAARLASLMRGTLTVASVLGEGSCFDLTLPLLQQPASDPDSAISLLNGLQILVLQHHDPSRVALATQLRHWKTSVTEVGDAQALMALASFDSKMPPPYDVILLADNFPGIDPYALATRFLAQPSERAPRIVMMSSLPKLAQAHANPGQAQLAFLIRPVCPPELRECLIALHNPDPASTQIAGLSPHTEESLDILLVEDNLISSRVAQLILRGASHHVIVANSGSQALAHVESGHFDLILMDIQMPDMDGIEATERIRASESLRGMRTPIIALSAHALQEHRDRCQRAGMDGFLTKPIRRRELLNEIDRIGRRAESPSAVRPPPAKVIDRQSFLERVDGNLTMIDEILDAFPKHCAALMSSARKALAGRDMPTLSYSIHTLLGMFRNLSADGSADLAAQIEARIPEANHYELQKLFVLLERQVGLLSQALPSLAHRDTPISFKAIARPPPVMMTRRPSKQTAHRESMPV